MPDSHATASRRICGLPTLSRVEIVYTSRDLYENECDAPTRDPEDCAQTIEGTATGFAYPDGEDLTFLLLAS